MNIEKIAQIITDVAQEEILSRYQKLSEADIQVKKAGDLVTSADIETEKKLSARLKKLYPAAVLAGEESIAENSGLLEEVITADEAFLIDPVDGTNNFIKNNPRFAVMMVALRKGIVVASWIYLPAFDKMAFSETGSGSVVNGKKISFKKAQVDCAEMIGAAHIKRMPEDLRQKARANLVNFKANKPAFCAGYDYVALLEGEKDFSAYYRTLPWDHLPGTHMCEQAGGFCRKLLSGETYGIKDQYEGLLSAADEESWHRIRDALLGKDLSAKNPKG